MVQLKTDREFEIAAWKVRNLPDYNERLERAARRLDELHREHDAAALVIYEAALLKSSRPVEEIRDLVRSFRETWEDEEEPLSIARVSAILSVEGDEWFFGDEEIRRLTGQLLGQFQHRVAQYNYLDEREVLRRWADGYDTRLFIRRGIYDTEPVVGVITGFDLRLMQHLRYIAGADTAVPTPELARALEPLELDGRSGDETLLATVENLALRLDLPAPIAAEILEELAREDYADYLEPPEDLFAEEEPAEEDEEAAPAKEKKPPKRMSAEERAARRAARRGRTDPDRAGAKDLAGGDEPTRAQSAQSPNAPAAEEQEGGKQPEAPERGRGGDAPGQSGDKN